MAMTHRRRLIGNWKRCVYEAAAFDTKDEYAAALILDNDQSVDWWLRNDPALFRLPTPAGDFEPDFVLRTTGDVPAYVILEIKGAIFWDGPGSEARVKARAAINWCKTVNGAEGTEQWQFAIVIGQDVLTADNFRQMLDLAIPSYSDD